MLHQDTARTIKLTRGIIAAIAAVIWMALLWLSPSNPEIVSNHKFTSDEPVVSDSLPTQAEFMPSAAATQSTPDNGGAAGALRVPLSPYAIKRLVDDNPQLDLRPLWRRLGVPAKLNTVWSQIGGQDDTSSIFAGGYEQSRCLTELYHLELDGAPGNEVLLKLHQGWLGSYTRYLVFSRRPDEAVRKQGWKLLGYADHDFTKYEQPSHRFVNATGKRWLVIRVQTGSGSGFARYHERWYEVSNAGVREVLTIPASGHASSTCLIPKLDIKSRFVKYHVANNVEAIKILFSATWQAPCTGRTGDRPKTLWIKNQEAIYVRRPGGMEYTLDPSRSQINTRELNQVYNLNDYSQDFLENNFARLSQVIARKDRQLTEWVQLILEHADDSATKQRLLRQLRQ